MILVTMESTEEKEKMESLMDLGCYKILHGKQKLNGRMEYIMERFLSRVKNIPLNPTMSIKMGKKMENRLPQKEMDKKKNATWKMESNMANIVYIEQMEH